MQGHMAASTCMHGVVFCFVGSKGRTRLMGFRRAAVQTRSDDHLAGHGGWICWAHKHLSNLPSASTARTSATVDLGSRATSSTKQV